MLSSVYNAVQWGEHTQPILAYENFGIFETEDVAPAKIMFVVIQPVFLLNW